MAATVTVHLQPRASRSEIKSQPDGSLLVRVTAPPVENAANQALLQLLAKTFRVSRSSLSIIRGVKSRQKVVEVAGISAAELAVKVRSLGVLHV